MLSRFRFAKQARVIRDLFICLQTEGFPQDDNETIALMYELCHPSFVETLWDQESKVYKTCCDRKQVTIMMHFDFD